MSGLVLVAAVVLGAWGYRAIRAGSPDPEALWSQAQADLRDGRFDAVDRALARLGRLREPTPPDRMLRGQLAMALGRPDEALAELARVPDDHGLAAQARLLAGQIERRRDRYRFAEEALREAVRLDPKLVQAHRELIVIYGYQRRRSELAGEFRALSQLMDLGFQDLFRWGLMQSETWEPLGIVRVLEGCVAADPGDYHSRLALSELMRSLGALDRAEEALSGLALDTPEVIAAQVRIALDRNDRGRAERLLASGPPGDPLLARLRGRMALSRGDARTALRDYRIACEAHPDVHEVLTGLITALRMLGDSKALAPLLDLAEKHDRLRLLILQATDKPGRDEPDLPLRLGDACADLHRDAEARGWYKFAIVENPLNSRAQRALYRLDAAARAGRPREAPGRERPGPPPGPQEGDGPF
jgi:tetratricopeptide (TPR) repeat protein